MVRVFPLFIVLSILYFKTIGIFALIFLAINVFINTRAKKISWISRLIILFIFINIVRVLNQIFFYPDYLLNAVSEIKFLLFLIILILINYSSVPFMERISINKFIKIFILCITILLLYAILNGSNIFRFVDEKPLYVDINSIYLGAVLVLFIAVSPLLQKLLLTLMVFINLSTTPILGLYIYIVNAVKEKKILFVISFIFIIMVVISQLMRGRALNDFLNWDRIQLISAYFNSHLITINFQNVLFGYGPVTPLGFEFINNITNEKFVDYILLESQPQFSSILHNEYLRIFHSYGLFGLFLTGIVLLKVFKNMIYFIYPVMTMMMFNSILYPTSIMIVIVLIAILLREKNESKDISNNCCL